MSTSLAYKHPDVITHCFACGKEIKSKGKHKYFCPSCMVRRRKEGVYSYKKTCPVCGKLFYTNYRLQDTCKNIDCKREYRKQVQLEEYHAAPEEWEKRNIQKDINCGLPGNYVSPGGHEPNMHREMPRTYHGRKCQFVLDSNGKTCDEPVMPGNRFLCRVHWHMAGDYEGLT